MSAITTNSDAIMVDAYRKVTGVMATMTVAITLMKHVVIYPFFLSYNKFYKFGMKKYSDKSLE